MSFFFKANSIQILKNKLLKSYIRNEWTNIGNKYIDIDISFYITYFDYVEFVYIIFIGSSPSTF